MEMKPSDSAVVWTAGQNSEQSNVTKSQNLGQQKGVVEVASSLEAVLMAGRFLPKKMFWTFGDYIEKVKHIGKFLRFMG